MRTALFFFCLLYSATAFTQSEQADSSALVPLKSSDLISDKVISTLSVISCFPSPKHDTHYLGPNGSRGRGAKYQSLARLEKIDIRTGLRGAYSHYYINGIRVSQDFTPGEIIDDIDIITGGTPAFDEGTSLFPSQNPLLVY